MSHGRDADQSLPRTDLTRGYSVQRLQRHRVGPPWWIPVLPMVSQQPASDATTFASPPIMIQRVPPRMPTFPTATGASTAPTPRGAAAFAISNAASPITRAAFGFRRFAHYRIRTLLYAGRPNWALLATVTPR